MTKNEYMETITTSRAALTTLRSDLKKLRRLEALAKEITGADKMVSLDVVAKTIAEKVAQEKEHKAKLEKAKRIVKKMEEIEDIEAGKAKKAPAKKSKAAAPATPAEKTAKAPKTVSAAKSAKAEKPAGTKGQSEAVA